jgi:guanosine-3',5'-bis(diphosphate) 3'-pyrophosphohydrolase
MDTVTKARELASYLHKDQVHNNNLKTPYIFHLEEVAELVKKAGGSEEEIAAAWLHDSVEDTQITIEEIQEKFGNEVASIVANLTDLPDWIHLSQKERKAKQAERVMKASASTKLVKLADQTSNVKIVGMGTMVDWSWETHLIYIEGAKQIAEVCKRISPFLDALFIERYENAQKNLNSLKA